MKLDTKKINLHSEKVKMREGGCNKLDERDSLGFLEIENSPFHIDPLHVDLQLNPNTHSGYLSRKRRYRCCIQLEVPLSAKHH